MCPGLLSAVLADTWGPSIVIMHMPLSLLSSVFACMIKHTVTAGMEIRGIHSKRETLQDATEVTQTEECGSPNTVAEIRDKLRVNDHHQT